MEKIEQLRQPREVFLNSAYGYGTYLFKVLQGISLDSNEWGHSSRELNMIISILEFEGSQKGGELARKKSELLNEKRIYTNIK